MQAEVRQISDGIHLVHGSNTNWVVLADGDEVTLIDTGYLGDRQQLLASLAAVGSSPEAVTAVLITHAHNDHLGSAEFLRSSYGTPVYLHEAEVPHARREFLQQVSVGQVVRNSWRPGVLPLARQHPGGGRVGVRFPPGDPGGLATALLRRLDDAPRRAELSAAAADWVRRYDWATVGDELLAVYETVAAGAGRVGEDSARPWRDRLRR